MIAKPLTWSVFVLPLEQEFGSGLAGVPVQWEFRGTRVPIEFLGGFIDVSQDPESMAVRPAIGWAVCRDSPGGPGPRLH